MDKEELKAKLYLAKDNDNVLLELLEKYKPLMIKYSTINGIFYEDLYSNIIEITIKIIKKRKFKNL